MDKKDININLVFPFESNSYSDDEIFDNTYNNNNDINNNINNSRPKKQNKIKSKILIPSDNKNIINNNIMHNTLKQSNSNSSNNYLKRISNNKLNEINNNKFAKIKNTKKKKDINQIKGKYKSLKHMMENNDNNKMLKGKINNNKNSNLYYNKYVKEENKMINYNYFVLNPKNITENKKTENNLIQNIIKYPINKNPTINKNIYIDRVHQKNKIKTKNKDLHIYLRNSFKKENNNEKDNYLTNSQEILFNSLNNNGNNVNNININTNITETIINKNEINNNNNLIQNNNKENIHQFSRTFVKTIEPKENNEINLDKLNININRQNKKNGKSYKKKLLNNSVTQNKNITNNNRVKKKDLTIEIFQNKNSINEFLNKDKIKFNNIIPSLNNTKTPISYNTSINNTINNINNNNKNISLNQKNKNKNKNNKLTIYKKRKISNHKCQSKIKKINLDNDIDNENENENNTHNYFTESKKMNLNNFIALTKNVKKVELFNASTDRKSLKLNNNINNINNINNKKENQISYVYSKSTNIGSKKFKKNSKNNYSNPILDYSYDKNLILNTKVNHNTFFFAKKYINCFIKRPLLNISHITKRIKLRAPINKLCLFSKNIILKEDNNNTILEVNNSSKFNNTNKNMEILDEIEDNDNEDFNIEEYEKNNNVIKEEKPKKNIFKIEKGLEKLCRIFFRNLEIKNKKNNLNLNLNLKKEKSEPNINFKRKKISKLFSSTIQNWNFIDKKNYQKEDENDINNNINNINNNVPFNNNNNKINKKRKRKKHSLLLNIHKAFSEEKIRDQINTERRSVNLNSRFLFIKNQNEEINPNNNINNINDIINQREKYINIIDNLTKENYINSLNVLFKLISNQNNENTFNINSNYNNFEILLNNQFTFTEIIVDRATKFLQEKINMTLIAQLCYDLYIKIITDFIYINKKKAKGENLKSILKTECKQKFDECDIITLLNISNKKIKNDQNFFRKIKNKLLGVIDLITELIKVKMISQKTGMEYLDNLKKRINSFDEDIKCYNDIDINLIKDIKHLYYEGELFLVKKLSVIIQQRKKPKHIQNLKNFIEDNIIPIINNKNLEQKLVDEFRLFLNEIKNNDFFKDINLINEK